MVPAGRLESRQWMDKPDVHAVLAALTVRGQTVRFVGGCVRDSVAGRTFTEVDLATPDDPEMVSELLTAAGLTPIFTGLAHGTITTVAGHRPFQITTLRVDLETTGRHARVAFTDEWEADAARRDFTCNALYADPDGTLFDPTGGLADLRAGRIRFVGDPATRVEEDYLRILRFFRFYAHYGSPPPDAAALAACRAHASGLALLSAERVAHELLRLLAAPEPASVLRLMQEADVLDRLVPEATDFARLARMTARDGAAADPVRRLGAVLATDRAGAVARAEALRLSTRDRKRLADLADAPRVTAEGGETALRRLLYARGRERYVDVVYLRWAEDPDGVHFGWLDGLTLPDRWEAPPFPLSGEDALTLGLEGPAIGRALGAVKAWWVDSDFAPGRDGCLARLREAAET